MKILKYIGKKEYIDPQRRFIAKPNDLVEFIESEANQLLEGAGKQWQLAVLSEPSIKVVE